MQPLRRGIGPGRLRCLQFLGRQRHELVGHRNPHHLAVGRRVVTASAPAWQVCYGSPTPFPAIPGTSGTTVIGGTTYHTGLLLPCILFSPDHTQPCLISRQLTAAGGVTLTFLALGDPFYRVICARDAGSVTGDRRVDPLPSVQIGQGHNDRRESPDVGLDRADLPGLRRGEPGPVSALRLLRNSPRRAQPPPQEVRKTVTIVFCDLKDSTALGDRLDSEALREVLALYFSAMKPVLDRHGGTIEKYIGDAIMAVFGLPRMHEDDALRAVRAAAQMREALAELNVTLRAEFGVTLENRTGVNTGEVVTGDTGGSQRLATGDTVNVAARLEQAAPTGEILIGESTYRLVRDTVEVVPVEPLTLKGKPEPVPAYRLLSVTAGATSARPADRPLIGRAREIAALDAEFRRSVAGSECRLVTLLGEAGVGKSRLIEEFVRSIADEAAVLQGRCLSYGDGITFWPLAEVFRQAAGIVPEDSEEDAHAKLASCFGEQLADATSRIESVMGLSQHQYGKDELSWAVRAVLEELVRRRPLVVVFDDIHWAEATFLDLIEHILDASLRVPLLLVCTARRELHEDRPSFAAGRPAASQIELGELSREECGLVVRNLLGEASLPEPLGQRILGLAEGNPLFIEQMLSMLIDDGLLREQAGRWVFSGAAEAVSVPGNRLVLAGCPP